MPKDGTRLAIVRLRATRARTRDSGTRFSVCWSARYEGTRRPGSTQGPAGRPLIPQAGTASLRIVLNGFQSLSFDLSNLLVTAVVGAWISYPLYAHFEARECLCEKHADPGAGFRRAHREIIGPIPTPSSCRPCACSLTGAGFGRSIDRHTPVAQRCAEAVTASAVSLLGSAWIAPKGLRRIAGFTSGPAHSVAIVTEWLRSERWPSGGARQCTAVRAAIPNGPSPAGRASAAKSDGRLNRVRLNICQPVQARQP